MKHTPGRETHQNSGDNERLVRQRLGDINVQAGGVHCQGVVGIPDPDLTEPSGKKIKRNSRTAVE